MGIIIAAVVAVVFVAAIIVVVLKKRKARNKKRDTPHTATAQPQSRSTVQNPSFEGFNVADVRGGKSLVPDGVAVRATSTGQPLYQPSYETPVSDNPDYKPPTTTRTHASGGAVGQPLYQPSYEAPVSDNPDYKPPTTARTRASGGAVGQHLNQPSYETPVSDNPDYKPPATHKHARKHAGLALDDNMYV
jgi:cytoskeletal protein RodZ